MVLGTGVLVARPAGAAVDPCTTTNKVACENSKPGTPQSVWDVSGAGDSTIQGFATDTSVNVGGTIGFKIDTTASAYSIDIYRLGYYNGDGARKIASVTPSASLPQHQPACITDSGTELYDCGNWSLSASWNVPSTAVSGVYIAKLTRPDLNDSSHITFVVRDDSSTSDVVYQTSDPTWQAYNTYGGADFYEGGANGRAYKISYNRPVVTRDASSGRDFFFSAEYPLVRFMEQNGYDVSYISGVDTARSGALLKQHKVFVDAGHDEYWSAAQRANVLAARDAGVNLMFLSGNEMYWHTRFEASADTSHTSWRTLVCYKETWANQKSDPTSEWTGTWRDPRLSPVSAGAGLPENGVTGTAYMSNETDLPVTVPAEQGKLRLWRNTTLGSQAAGTQTALAAHTIGYESDEDLDNGFRPQGLIDLSTTTGPTSQYLQDFGSTVAPGTTTHHLTEYRASSGALVFSAGTIQWTWGLDQNHDGAGPPADSRMRQAQVNLFADMGAQPLTLAAGLTAAAKSTDTVGPTTTITSPADGSTVANGTQVSVTGTASDAAGRVAGVEVSIDGGTTWRPATGTSSWTYSYIQHGSGSTPLKARAVDDSANIGAAATVTRNVTCPCSVYGSTTPATPATSDASAVELGLRFSPTTDGFVSGVRFYKGTGNTGTHTGSLWSAGGHPAGPGHVHQRDGHRLAAGDVRVAGRGQCRADVRGLLHGPERALRQPGRRLLVRRGPRRAARRRRWLQRGTRRRVRRTGHLPGQRLPARAVLRRRDVHDRGHLAPRRDAAVAARGVDERPDVVDGHRDVQQGDQRLLARRHGQGLGGHHRRRDDGLRPDDQDRHVHAVRCARRLREVRRHRDGERHDRRQPGQRRRLVVHHRQATGRTRCLSVRAVRRHDRAPTCCRLPIPTPSRSACTSPRRSTARSPGSGSTRARTTPARTSARCGRAPAPSWPLRRSPARALPAGRP